MSPPRRSATAPPATRREQRLGVASGSDVFEKVTGIPGFAARSIRAGRRPRSGQSSRRRVASSADGRWWWKGDTSSDEVDGHYFAYAVYYDVAAPRTRSAKIRPYVARITDHILDHGYYYVGPAGQAHDAGASGRRRSSIRISSGSGTAGSIRWRSFRYLKVAEHIVGGPRYAAAARELIEKHGYAINTVLQKINWPPEAVNHSDDELAFFSLLSAALVRAATSGCGDLPGQPGAVLADRAARELAALELHLRRRPPGRAVDGARRTPAGGVGRTASGTTRRFAWNGFATCPPTRSAGRSATATAATSRPADEPFRQAAARRGAAGEPTDDAPLERRPLRARPIGRRRHKARRRVRSASLLDGKVSPFID